MVGRDLQRPANELSGSVLVAKFEAQLSCFVVKGRVIGSKVYLAQTVLQSSLPFLSASVDLGQAFDGGQVVLVYFQCAMEELRRALQVLVLVRKHRELAQGDEVAGLVFENREEGFAGFLGVALGEQSLTLSHPALVHGVQPPAQVIRYSAW